MINRHTSLMYFVLAALLPFVVSFTMFVVLERHSLLTSPEEHIASLKRTGRTTTLVSLTAWKQALARDESCQAAETIVIGSSRVREIDRRVTGTTTCNLYVDGLATGGFMRLARALPPVTAGVVRTVYVGIDHFWLWSGDVDTVADWATTLAHRSRVISDMWQVGQTLTFFQWRDLAEVLRRYRAEPANVDEQASVWYADGHLEHPMYYLRKRAGRHSTFTRAEVEGVVESLFGGQSVHGADLARLSDAVELLHAKGYGVRLYWNPVSAAHVAAARQHFGATFQQAIDAVDRQAARLPVDWYLPAAETLDARRFGCTESDYFDSTHVDVDCMRRLFSIVFRNDRRDPRVTAVSTMVTTSAATP